MGNKLQARRDQLESGDDVLVTESHHGITKHKKARVLELVRGAARVKFEDGSVALVRYNKVTKVEVEEVQEEPQAQPARVVGFIKPATSAPIVQMAPPPSPAPSNPPKDLAELEAWLDMGSSLVDVMSTKLSRLERESEELRNEADRLIALADAKDAESEKLEQKLKLLKAITQ